jgi:hypothetical protein
MENTKTMESYLQDHNIVMDLINTLPGNSFVNTVKHGKTEEAVFRVHGYVAVVGGGHMI